VCKVSEGIRVDKLRRDSSFVIPWRRTQETVRRKFEQEGALDREESLKGRNQRSGFTEEPCEIPLAVRS
jgi:hypothetical protein